MYYEAVCNLNQDSVIQIRELTHTRKFPKFHPNCTKVSQS